MTEPPLSTHQERAFDVTHGWVCSCGAKSRRTWEPKERNASVTWGGMEHVARVLRMVPHHAVPVERLKHVWEVVARARPEQA